MPVPLLGDTFSSSAAPPIPSRVAAASDPEGIPPVHSSQAGPSIESLELQDLDRTSRPQIERGESSRTHHSPTVHNTAAADSLEDDHLLADSSDESDSELSDGSQMSRKAKAPKSDRTGQADHSSGVEQNGHATANARMQSLAGHRRKHTSIDSTSSAAQIAHLISRESFSLDDEVPLTPGDKRSALKGFWELPVKDRKNFSMLVLLYFLQGIPMGLAGGSVPFLLKSHISYGQIGVFSLASYPYALKLLWSPLVDAVWTPKVGRRKSWILPIQTLSGIGMIWLGGRIEKMMVDAGADGGAGIWGFTWWWFFLVFMCATQDIAVDGRSESVRFDPSTDELTVTPGWALTLLSSENLSYASTAQTVGLTAGQFLSYTVFLALNSPDFANKWFRSVPQQQGLITLGGYLTFWGWFYLVVTIGLAALKREEKTKNNDGIIEVYKEMGGILKLRNIQIFVVIHLIAKIGFQANDAVTNLKLLDKGFSQEDLALTVLIDFPFEILLGYYVGKWSSVYPPMHLWCWAFVGRLIAAAFAQVTVMLFPVQGVTTWYLLLVIVEHVFSTFMSTVMFVAVSAFHAKIADPSIGGTYMTLLAT